MKDEVVWLVEENNLCAGFGGSGLIWVPFTNKSALKFETEALARMFIHKNNLEDASAREHMFVAPYAPAIDEPERDSDGQDFALSTAIAAAELSGSMSSDSSSCDTSSSDSGSSYDGGGGDFSGGGASGDF